LDCMTVMAKFPWDVWNYKHNNTASHAKELEYSITMLWEPQIRHKLTCWAYH
jgi:hypothetical protein